MQQAGCWRITMLPLLVLQIYLASLVCGQTQEYGANTKAENQITELYKVLHDVALPSSTIDSVTDKRLVLLLPGKILSFSDYYPGEAYIRSLGNQDPEARFVDIPPRIMENMFTLADIVPGIDPFNGFETGESMAAIYRDIVGRIDIKNFEALSEEKKKRLSESLDYLLQLVQDPEERDPDTNEFLNVTKLTLYRRYQQRYYEEKENQEKIIEAQRLKLPSLQYQLWFSQSFPALQSKVDAALLDWIVYGDKDTVELYRSRLDTSSAAIALLEAKSALRSSETTSLDRSQKIYPVTFVPEDWYIYINDTPIVMTRDQIQKRIGDLESQRLILLQSKIQGDACSSSLGGSLDSANTTDTNLTIALAALVAESNDLKCQCVSQSLNDPDTPKANITACSDYEKKLAEVIAAASAKGASLGELRKLQSLIGGDDDAVVDEVLDRINSELNELSTQLPFAPGNTDDIPGSLGQTVDPNEKWFSFEYNSKQTNAQSSSDLRSYYSTYSASSRSYSASASYSWWGNRRSNSYSSSYGYSRSSASSSSNTYQRLTESEVVVKGKLLRVTVQRPWFRPDLFKNQRLTIADDVSPGPLKEKDFIETATPGKYKLPQYVTGFLLARNVEMEFRGLDKQSSDSVVRSSYQSYHAGGSSRASSSGGWGCFGFASSSSYSSGFSSAARTSASFQASSTASGLKIGIPGVQLIGYYTQVVNEFPISN